MIEIESPLLDRLWTQFMNEARQNSIMELLEDRFGPIPSDLGAKIRTITDDQKLRQLHLFASKCPDLDAFRAALHA